MQLTPTEQAGHGYTITAMKIVDGGYSYGILWYDTGEHNGGYATAEAAEKFAEEWVAKYRSRS